MALYRDTDEQERKLFVGGLNKDLTSEEKLKNFFKDCGEIVDVTIMRDTNKVSRGFGFVLFEDHKSVDLIMTRKREDTKFELDGHNIEVKRALPKVPGGNAGSSRTGGMFRKIFVGGLASTVTEEDVEDYFEQFGRVTEVELLKDRDTGRLRGFAFVTFEDEDSADKCIQRRSHEINKKLCEVKRAQTRSNLNKDDNRDHHRDHRGSGNSGGSGGMKSNASAASGMLDMATVNTLIAEAHMKGYNEGLRQASQGQNYGGLGGGLGALGSLGGGNAAPSPLLQTLLNQSGLGGSAASRPTPAPAPPVSAPAPAAQANLAALLLQSGRVDASALEALGLSKDLLGLDSQRQSNGQANSYSTAYPPPGSYNDMYYNQSGSSYGPSKVEDDRKGYRPY